MNQFEYPFLTLMQHCNRKCKQLVDVHRTQNSLLRNGGSDPLDWIFVFKNEDDPNLKHWHYIGLGLSDIYCYTGKYQYDRDTGKIEAGLYPIPNLEKPLSGYGFELTFRLKCNSDDEWQEKPPSWPTNMMQSLARYTFKSRNIFTAGEHVAWNKSLDENDVSEIQHILMTQDLVLDQVETYFGLVRFIQIVGILEEELQAARQLNAKEVLRIMAQRQETGGQLLVTDMRRGEDIFQLDPVNRGRIDQEILRSGSDMTQISTNHKYSPIRPQWFDEVERIQDEPALRTPHDISNTRTPSRMSYGSESALMLENIEIVDELAFNSIYLMLPYKTAKVLPIALNGRLPHRKSFSFQNFRGDLLTSLVPEDYPFPTLVSHDKPFAKHGNWLQILITDQLREKMLELIGDDFSNEPSRGPLMLPKNYCWPQFNFYITVVEEELDI